MSETNGLVLVLTGDGKGKTTSAFGQALRAAGSGTSVGIVQFIKGPWRTGEVTALHRADLPIHVARTGLGFTVDGLRDPRISMDRHREAAREGLEKACRWLASGEFGMVVLDEVIAAIAAGLIEEGDVLRAVRARAPNVHVILTGRDASPAIQAVADLVSEVRLVKHHYAGGVQAQQGIEF